MEAAELAQLAPRPYPAATGVGINRRVVESETCVPLGLWVPVRDDRDGLSYVMRRFAL